MKHADKLSPPPKSGRKPKRWRMEEALRIIEEYAADLRETIVRLRRKLY
jgi:hypothetical protein